MTVSEFIALCGHEANLSFSTRLGLRCAKIYHSLYNQAPKKQRRAILATIKQRRSGEAPRAWRNKVCVYPCGVIEQAYRQLTTEHASTSILRFESYQAAWSSL
jgi:hypothetical protein